VIDNKIESVALYMYKQKRVGLLSNLKWLVHRVWANLASQSTSFQSLDIYGELSVGVPDVAKLSGTAVVG